MDWSSSTLLNAVRPHIDPALVGEPALAACTHVASGLNTPGSVYYLECRLDRDPRVDFLVLLKHRRRVEPLLSPDVPSPAWQRNLALLRAWADGHETLSDLQLVWLEYDIDAALNRASPQASVSVCVEADYLRRFSGPVRPNPAQALRLAYAAARHLVAPERRKVVGSCLERCVRALPPGGSLIYISEMSTREPELTKLYLAVPKPAVLHYLVEINWPGKLDAVFKILSTCHRDVEETVFLDVSIDREVTPRLGFAFSQLQAREMQSFDPCWRELLETAALPKDKRAALERWPGQSEQAIEGVRAWVRRWLDIKLVLEADAELRYKAYLGYHARLAPPFA